LSQPSFNQIGGFNANGTLALPGYDILFSPSGQLMTPYGAGQVYLWIRDPNKGVAGGIPGATSMSPYNFTPASYLSPGFQNAVSAGGEQLLVGIRGYSGATGVTPVFWPTSATGPTSTPYYYASSAANSP
jgi:hypothetical protein